MGSASLQRASTGNALPTVSPFRNCFPEDDFPTEFPTSPLTRGRELCRASRVRKVPTSRCYRPRQISRQRTTSPGRKGRIPSRPESWLCATARIRTAGLDIPARLFLATAKRTQTRRALLLRTPFLEIFNRTPRQDRKSVV